MPAIISARANLARAVLFASASCSFAPRHIALGPLPDAGRRESPLMADNPAMLVPKDAGAPDAFFINDPAPPMCGPDGSVEPSDAGVSDAGAPDCPSDKNREGCRCAPAGQKAACWPGRRINRNHGICKDGQTTCQSNGEFPPTWGPCEGYVLPKDGAVQGPEACRCFSNGTWLLSNLVPCVAQDTDALYVYSSRPDPQNGFACDPLTQTPPPKPTTAWSSSTLEAECAGQFELCYTMKAGSAQQPSPSDCVLMRSCLDVWYGSAGKQQKLPDLPGWLATDASCAQRFADGGGYGEMSVLGKSAECDAVDDGHGAPYVFKRTVYCSPHCASTPDAPACRGCMTGGSGQF